MADQSIEKVDFLPEALEDLERLDRVVARRLMKKIRWLAENFDAAQTESLGGPLSGLLKLRVGDYRVLYEADRNRRVLTIHMIGHRREIYR